MPCAIRSHPCSQRDATTGHRRASPPENLHPTACAPTPLTRKTDHRAASSVGSPGQLQRRGGSGVSLSAVTVLLGDLVGGPCQPGQLPHRSIPEQEQIRPSALRPTDAHRRQPGRSLCARAGGVREDRYQASRSVRRRIGSARTNARTRMRDIEIGERAPTAAPHAEQASNLQSICVMNGGR